MRPFTKAIMRSIAAGVLLVSAPALVPCGLAQVTVSPATVEASVPVGQQGDVEIVVTNGGMAPVDLFAVPLPAEGMPEEPPGTLLFWKGLDMNGHPYNMAMTSKGRLFVVRYGGTPYTLELTPELDSLRFFEHPEIGNASSTTGMAWMPPDHALPGYPEGTLWWMDVAVDCDLPHCTVESTLLLEGDLDGNATGRTVELVTGPGYSGPGITYDRGVPNGLAYDAEAAGGTGLFYYVDAVNEDICAIDVNGQVADGYPVPQTDYDPDEPMSILQAGLDATRGAD